MTVEGDSTAPVRSSRTPQSAEGKIYALVKERLLEGTYGSGERLVVEELAAETSVSRQPVYDALRRLSAEGFVDIVPQVGCRVRRHEDGEIAHFFELFAAVEGAASALAAQRRSSADLSTLRRLNAQIGGLAALDAGSERAHGYRMLNREFHSTIHRICGTPIVERICSAMYDQADFFINGAAMVSPFADAVPERYQDHELIIAALDAGDGDAARTAASDHIYTTVHLIEATIRAYGPRLA